MEDPEHINVGAGKDLTIKELVELVREIVYPEANLLFDHSKPDGTPQKLLNIDRLATSAGTRKFISPRVLKTRIPGIYPKTNRTVKS